MDSGIWKKIIWFYYLDYNKAYPIPQPIYYTVYDIFSYNDPELIINDGYGSHKCTIYTYIDSKVTEIFSIYNCEYIYYYPDSRRLSAYTIENGYNYFSFYYIRDPNRFIKDFDFSYTEHEDKTVSYEFNGEKVTKEQYNKYLDEYSDKIPGLYENKVELSGGTEYCEKYKKYKR